MSLMIKKSQGLMLPSFFYEFQDKYREVIIKNDDGKEYLFLRILPKSFVDKNEKINFFQKAMALRVGTCPKEIMDKNNGANSEIVLMFIKEI